VGLARKNVTGVLEIDGNPEGAIYLDKGHITFARASWSPDLVARLYGVLQPTAEVRELLDSEDRPDHDLGTILIRRGCLTADQLHAILQSIVVDAVTVLTVPLAEGSLLAGIRFESARTHWAQSFCRLPVHLVQAEAAGQAERMTSVDLAAGLVRAGRSVPCRAGTGAASQSGRPAETSVAMPSRRPAAATARLGGGPGDDGAGEDAWRSGGNQFATLPAESLKRVLEGLRRLS